MMIPELAVLGSLVRDLHSAMSQIYYMALPVAILLAVVMGYLSSGGANYIDTIKRVFVATILLIAFPDISNAIISVCDGIALRIDDMSGLDTFMRMVQEKSASYSHSKNVLLLSFDDLIIAALSFCSFALIYISRYLTIAMYYFFWVLLSAISPILILFYIFPKTAHITGNLFKSLIHVASWKICWAILSAMLRSLSFGNIYATEGYYITLILLNFVIAIAMLLTPMIVKSIVGEGAHAMAETLGTGAVAAMVALPGRIAYMKAKAVQASQSVSRPIMQRYQSYQTNKNKINDLYKL
jgi:hypothetical protein